MKLLRVVLSLVGVFALVSTGAHLVRFLAVGGGLPLVASATPPNFRGSAESDHHLNFYDLFTSVSSEAVVLVVIIMLFRLALWQAGVAIFSGWVFVHWFQAGTVWLTDPSTKLGFDLLLIVAFGGTHYLLRDSGPVFRNHGVTRFKSFAPHEGFIRAIYTMIATASLELILMAWQPTPELVVWDVRSRLSLKGQYLWFGVFCFGIVSTISSALALDAWEFLGLKQAAASSAPGPYVSPATLRPTRARLLLRHAAHPILLGPLLMLFAAPLMTLDRLMLALVVSTYISQRHTLDTADVEYCLNSATNQIKYSWRTR